MKKKQKIKFLGYFWNLKMSEFKKLIQKLFLKHSSKAYFVYSSQECQQCYVLWELL